MPPPTARRVVSFCIPDDDEWRPLFWGHVNRLGSWLQYERDREKQGKPIADVWRDIISEAIALGEDEVSDCMAQKIRDVVCAALDECLQPFLELQFNTVNVTLNDQDLLLALISGGTTTIQNAVTKNTTVNYNTYPPTQGERVGTTPITETKPTDGMTDEQFYGVVISIVNGICDAMLDWFEVLEAQSNALELAAIVAESIPVVGDSVGAVAALADFVLEVAQENFMGADTTGRRLAWADDLYCRGIDQKALTLPMIGESLATVALNDVIDWNNPLESVAEIAAGATTAELIYYTTLAFGLAIWTVTGDFAGLITRAAWRYWVNTGKASPQSPTPACSEADCRFTMPNFQERAGIMYGFGRWVTDGLRSQSEGAGYQPAVFSLDLGDTGAIWQGIAIDTTMTPGARGQLRVSLGDVYSSWANLTETTGEYGATFSFNFETPNTYATRYNQILLETFTGPFTVRRLRFFGAVNMPYAECD
jgi:hypothetical protein